jgi:hypothetical protein
MRTRRPSIDAAPLPQATPRKAFPLFQEGFLFGRIKSVMFKSGVV